MGDESLQIFVILLFTFLRPYIYKHVYILGYIMFHGPFWCQGMKPINCNCVHCVKVVKTGLETGHCQSGKMHIKGIL